MQRKHDPASASRWLRQTAIIMAVLLGPALAGWLSPVPRLWSHAIADAAAPSGPEKYPVPQESNGCPPVRKIFASAQQQGPKGSLTQIRASVLASLKSYSHAVLTAVEAPGRQSLALGQPPYLCEGEDLQGALADDRNAVIIFAGRPIDDDRFARQLVWIESAPIYVSEKHHEVQLSKQDVVDIFMGLKTDWADLKSGQGPIKLYAMGEDLRVRRLTTLIRSITHSDRSVSDFLFQLEPTYQELARVAGSDKDAMVFGLLASDPDGLVKVPVDGVSVDGVDTILAQPDQYWQLVGVNPADVPPESDSKPSDPRLCITDTSPLNPDRPQGTPDRGEVPPELAGRVYPLRQSIYVYTRRATPGSPRLDMLAVALRYQWLGTIGMALASPPGQPSGGAQPAEFEPEAPVAATASSSSGVQAQPPGQSEIPDVGVAPPAGSFPGSGAAASVNDPGGR